MYWNIFLFCCSRIDIYVWVTIGLFSYWAYRLVQNSFLKDLLWCGAWEAFQWDELKKSWKDMERFQNKAWKLVDLKKEVDAHNTPSDLAAKVTSLQRCMDNKEKALEKVKSIEVEFSTQVIAV